MSFKKIAITLIVLVGCSTMAFTTLLKSTDTVAVESSTAMEKYSPIVVFELFTSQGCSSCPPADVLLEQVKNAHENSVFALSYHVDYWNYIGWEGPFSSSKYTERQRDYNIKLKSRSNYTPELIVNGKEHFVGSDASKVNGAIHKYAALRTSNEVTLTHVEADKKTISFEFGILGDVQHKNLRAVLVLDERTTQVKRGENRNRSLTNSNVVVAEKTIDIAGSAGESFMTIPEIVNPDEKISLILLAENSNHDITGAAKAAVR